MLFDTSYYHLRCHVNSGKLTLISQSSDGIEKFLSVGGLSFDVVASKVMQINSCLFHSKGLAEYVLVADIDEFFIPKGMNYNFNDVINSIVRKNNEIDERRLRDHSIAHPYCYVRVQGEVVFNPTVHEERDIKHTWIGQR